MDVNDSYKTAVAFKFWSLYLLIVGFLILFVYYVVVFYQIRQRLLKPVFVLWLMFTLSIVFQILYLLLLIFPSRILPYNYQLESNTSRSRWTFQVTGYFRDTILQLAYLVFCYIYFEVKEKF